MCDGWLSYRSLRTRGSLPQFSDLYSAKSLRVSGAAYYVGLSAEANLKGLSLRHD